MGFWKKLFGVSEEPVVVPTPEPVVDTVPRADISYLDGKIHVKSYNAAFVADIRNKLGDVAFGKTDDEVVDLFTGRENLELEEPKLEVLHMGMSEDGQVKMKLDWNRAFIKHLKSHGIEGETEEQAIEQYLSFLTKTRDLIPGEDEAFAEVDAQLGREFEEAKTLANKRKPTRRRKVNRTSELPMPDSPESM